MQGESGSRVRLATEPVSGELEDAHGGLPPADVQGLARDGASSVALSAAGPEPRHTSSVTSICEPSSLFSASTREATFTTSPMTVYSLRRTEPMLPTTAGPEWMPMPRRVGGMRPVGDQLVDAREHLEPGRDRIRAGVPSAIGAPKTAMKPSPRNLFTMPRCSATASTAASKIALRYVTTSSGPCFSANAVKPRMSRNITQTSRSSLRASASPRHEAVDDLG